MASGLAHGITLLFIQGFLLCGFLGIFVYGQATNAVLAQNSVSPHLNGKRWTLPVTHTRKCSPCRVRVLFSYLVSECIGREGSLPCARERRSGKMRIKAPPRRERLDYAGVTITQHVQFSPYEARTLTQDGCAVNDSGNFPFNDSPERTKFLL